MDDQKNILKDVPEFNNYPGISNALSSIGIRKVFKEGDIILAEDTHIRSIPIVTRGSVRVMRTDNEGREILLYYIDTGESCIMSFLGGIHHETSKVKAIADEPTEVLFIPVEKVNLLIRDYPQWLDYIFRLYHKRFEELLEVVNDVAFKKVDERLSSLLQLKSEHSGSRILYVTHDQLAKECGTSRVVVSRLLKQMETQGMLKLSRNKISLNP